MNLELFKEKYNAEYIKSRSNPKCIYYSKLSEKKHREESKMFLAEGVKLTGEALKYAETKCLIISPSAVADEKVRECADAAYNKKVPIILADDSVFEKISTERAPQGVIAVVNFLYQLHVFSHLEVWQKNRRLIMLDEIRDPGNLGTIIRSAEALGVGGIILSGCADIYNSKTVRAAMGSLFRLPLFLADNTLDCVKILKNCGRRVLPAALTDSGMILGKYEISYLDCPIIGNEGHGISKEVIEASGVSIIIPMSGNTESLNASAAAACIMWEYFRNGS